MSCGKLERLQIFSKTLPDLSILSFFTTLNVIKFMSDYITRHCSLRV